MNRLIVLAVVAVISIILADTTLKSALAMPRVPGQVEAWRSTR